MIRRIQIEREFDHVVRATGGLIVSELVGKSPQFDNADYVFHDQKIIAELKCLREDKSNDTSTQSRLRRLWIKWRQKGIVRGSVPARIDSRGLSAACQTEMYRELGKPLKRRIQKANKQIRETKIALELPDYRGVLFIANNGNFLFGPAAMIHCIQMALQREFREIRNFVFFTANMHSVMKGVDRPVLFWIPFDMQSDAAIPEKFFRTLYEKWISRHIEVTGLHADATEMEDMEAFWFSQYV